MIVTPAQPIPNYMTAMEKLQDIGVQTETEDYKRDLEESANG